LDYEVEAVVMNLFYLHSRMAAAAMPADQALLNDDRVHPALTQFK
jgi:hypothetical protein